MKTQEQLQKMTDQQLAFELACLVFGADEVYMAKCGKVGTTRDDIASASGYVDINDWNWIMPLAVEHGVGYVTTKVRYNAFCGDDLEFYAYDSNLPQRAIAICLVLKMREGAE